ncbi:MAG: hypothetical protein IJD99_10485 [Clostridia bacterium]|nr:hypothetical protein [Clostridia bacterium]
MNEWDGRMCASCGYQPGASMVTPNALPPGTVLANRYVLGNALCVSRQSIAYAAWDQQMEQRMIITEFYPAVIVKRIQGMVTPQRNQAQFQVAMSRYQAYDGQQMLPLAQAFFGNNTAYRVYVPAEQPQLKKQADMLLDQPILFRNEMGQAQMTINALMIDPLPKERPFNRVGNPGARKKKKMLAAILSVLLVLVASCVIVLPMIATPVEQPVSAKATATPLAAQVQQATAAPVTEPPVVIAEATATAAVTDVPVLADATDAPIAAENTEAPVAAETTEAPVTADATEAPIAAEATTAPEEVITANAATAAPAPEVTAAPVVTEIPVIATEIPAAEPTATAVPTLAPSVDSWYLKVNAQLWQVDKDGNATNPIADASGLELDRVTISGLAYYKDIYHLNLIRLRSEEARTEFDLSGIDQDITLELPRGNYTLILGREEKLSEARVLSRVEEIPFSSMDGEIPYESITYTGSKSFETLCLDWFNLFEKAQKWASTNAVSVEMLEVSAAGFYAINDTYYSIGKDGALNQLSVVDKDSFYLVGTEADSLADFKIPLYPVQVPAQELDRSIFVKAMLTNAELNDEGLDVLSQLLTADGNATFYASRGKYELAILTNDAFMTADGQPYAISAEFTVDESGKLPKLNGDQMKAEVFRNCGLWAYQVGTNAPVICGGDMEQAELTHIFGELIAQDPNFALRNVAFENVTIGGKPLVFRDARVVRGDVVIPLAELMLPMTEILFTAQSADAADAVVVQPTVDTLADVVTLASIQGLKLTNGDYAFYPAADDSVKVAVAVSGDTNVTLQADQQQAVQKLLLARIADKGVGYVANVKKELEGQFVYQLDEEQLKLAASEVSGMDAQTVSGQKKYKVTIDCAPQKLEKEEKASLGIVYTGKETVNKPIELKFAANEDLDKLEKIALKDLVQWDGSNMSLALGPGVYRLYYISVDAKTDVETTKYSDPFETSEDLNLAMASRCEHQWQKELVRAATCVGKGAWMQVCKLCGEMGQELIEFPANGHDMLDATCTTPARCKVCGAEDSSHFPSLGHAPGKASTCTTNQRCTRCNIELEGALGHKPGAEPTCTTAQKCTRAGCGATLKEPLGHVDGAAATCTTAQKCTRCGGTLKAALGHAPGAAATCTTAQKCTRCGDTLKAQLGHNPGAEATCTTAQKCTRCSTTLKDKLGHAPGAAATCTTAQKCTRCSTTLKDKLGHAPGAAATCTTAQTCTRCGTTLKDKLGHAPGDGPTCTSAQKCTRCSTTLKDKLGHAPGAAATCTTAQTCTRCGATLKDKLGHAPGAAATCTTAQTCTRCGTTLKDKLGHAPGDGPTCTSAQKCTRCGTTLKDATGHSYGKWGNNTATCTAGGTETRSCKCGKTEARDTAALGHDFGKWYPKDGPTCETPATIQHTCSRCKHTEWEQTGNALGHRYVYGYCVICNAKDPNADEYGKGGKGD